MSSASKEILAVDGLFQFLLVPQEDFSEGGGMIQTGWAYQINIYFDTSSGTNLLFKGDFKTEEEAIAAGKERLSLYSEGRVNELQGMVHAYKKMWQEAFLSQDFEFPVKAS